jgi:restriction endonuclease Mrr
VNKELLFNTIKSLNLDKIDTETLLNKYYLTAGFNKFRASEEAQKNIERYIEFCNREVQLSNDNGTVSLINEKTNQNVTILNRNYFFIEELKFHLLNSISDQEFEVVCSKVLKNYLHAENTSVTKRSGDGGYDFFGTLVRKNNNSLFPAVTGDVFGQAKQYTGNISRPEVDKFIGFAQTNFTIRKFKPTVYIFATTSNFSFEALATAAEQGIVCWNGFQIASFIYQSSVRNSCDANELLFEYLNN